MAGCQSSVISPDWSGDTVVCIGGGPSLTPEDIDCVSKYARVIAINDAYKLAPWADILYACDLKWWNWHRGAPFFYGEKWTQDKAAAEKYGLCYIKGENGSGLSIDPHKIHTGSNSGAQAINLAYHKGASRVILLGYDMKPDDSGKQHWFGQHPDNVHSDRRGWLPHFRNIADQGLMTIINCSRETALDCFPKSDIEDIKWI